jgi:hypothetical protein
MTPYANFVPDWPSSYRALGLSSFLRFSPLSSVFLQPLDENAEFFKFDQSNLVIFYHILTEVRVEKWKTFFFFDDMGTWIDRRTDIRSDGREDD